MRQPGSNPGQPAYRDVAQLAERWSPKPNVGGSIPSVPAMTERKTDKEILDEYCKEMELPPLNDVFEKIMLSLVKRCRKDEPRLNSGIHLIDYCNMLDDDAKMDDFYGPDYFMGDS